MVSRMRSFHVYLTYIQKDDKEKMRGNVQRDNEWEFSRIEEGYESAR